MFGAAAQKKDSIKNSKEPMYLIENNDTIGFQFRSGFGIIKYDFPTLELSGDYHFQESTPTDRIFIGDINVAELINNQAMNLLLEYKKECYNDSTVWLGVYDWVDLAKINTVTDNMLDSSKNITSRKNPTFEDFLSWIEEKQNKNNNLKK